MMGMFPFWIERVYAPGTVGVMTRSGSLTNEIASMIVKAGYGISTLTGVGGDPVPGTRFSEMLGYYEDDPQTEALVLIGELGGTMEEEAAEYIADKRFSKPVVAFLGGRRAPEGRRMGHAGAISSGGKGTVKGKIEALESAGVIVASRPSQVGSCLSAVM